MNMALDVSRNRKLRPAPVGEGARVELQTTARRWKSAFDFVADSDANQPSSLIVAVRTGNWNYVWRSRFRRAGEHAAARIFTNVFELSGHGSANICPTRCFTSNARSDA